MDESSITRFYKAFSVLLLILSAVTSLEATRCATYASASSLGVYIDPPVYSATHIGETFEVNVRISGVESSLRLIGAEFRLLYNDTLIETQEELASEGSFFKSFGETYSKAFIFTDGLNRKYIHAFVLLLPSDTGIYSQFPEGEGTLATILFNASYRPIEPATASCDLVLHDVILVDSDLNIVTPTNMSGYYRIDSLKKPKMEVSPDQYLALRKGETFEVQVNVKEVDKDWHLVGLQFKLAYNTTLVETKPEWSVEGHFFEAYGPTWFQPIVGNNYCMVGVLLFPDEAGEFHDPFPEGEGTVATLKFRTVYQPVNSESSSCGLILEDTILVDDNSGTIPHETSGGEYMILPASSTIDQYRPIDIQADVGTIHFSGEIADFYALVTDYGKAVDPDRIEADLYFEGAQYLSLTDKIERVSNGLYRIPYIIPGNAETGTYLLLVQARYTQVAGTAIKSFTVSSTLSNWSSSITNIEANIATVLIPSIGQIKLDLAALNATLLSINDKVATIVTSVGNLVTSVENLNIRTIEIDGDIATVQTDLGTVKAKLGDLTGTAQASTSLLCLVVVLTVIAIISTAIVAFYSKKKQVIGTEQIKET
jgi:hypothetical protein